MEEGSEQNKQRPKRRISPDDYALFTFLKNNRDEDSVNLVFNHYLNSLEAHFRGQGIAEEDIDHAAIQTFARFKSSLELGGVRWPIKDPLWSIFLAFGRMGFPDYDWSVPHTNTINYLSKICLIDLGAEKRDAALNAITTAFREPARTDFSYTNYASVIEFEDLYQETMIELVKKFPRKENKHSARFYQYFKTIFFNKAADAWNSDQRSPESPIAELNQNGNFEKELKETEEICHNTEATLDNMVELYRLHELFGVEDSVRSVRKMLKSLEPRCRAIITLYYLEGASYKQLAEVLDMDLLSVGTTKARCMKSLRQAFQQIKK
ncbi:RNA polymerase sigma factor [Lewinella sp. W8]|uniref:RNA polymerase sigma factor n=1 Tax=Lewinella sp. W8 TaxID=2528208 RepID=UPI0010683CE2|nr:RNA polymerase sigma factor [Lewinella sp. W8]MTB51142.1 sigma-70 family RNA polymerase sigma factor [Lewinella sp. W8]